MFLNPGQVCQEISISEIPLTQPLLNRIYKAYKKDKLKISRTRTVIFFVRGINSRQKCQFKRNELALAA